MELLESPAIKASGNSTKSLPRTSSELCDRMNLLVKKEQAGINSNITDEEIVGTAEILIEYKCISLNSIKFYYLNV